MRLYPYLASYKVKYLASARPLSVFNFRKINTEGVGLRECETFTARVLHFLRKLNTEGGLAEAKYFTL